MNKIILLVLFVFSYCVGSSQAITQRGTTAVTVQDARLFAQYNFRPPVFSDTTQANLQIGLDSCGALIFSRDINSYYLRACSPKRWVAVSSGGGSGNAWNIGGNASPSSPNIGTTTATEFNTITNGIARTKIKGSGIARSSASRNKYLMIDTTDKYLYYGDANTATPNLQQVTTAGATSTNNITVNGLTLGSLGSGLDFTGNTNQLAIRNVGTFDNLLEINYGATGSLKFGGGTYPYVEIINNPSSNISLDVPNISGRIPISVNGNTADVNGNITIPTIDTTNKFVNRLTRIPGKDSIIYFVGANRFAIKDSVGVTIDTISLSNRINSKLSISDTASMLTNYFNKVNYGLSKSGQTISVDSATLSNKYLRIVDTTNKFVNRLTRILGKDSIIYFVGGTRYAIKDSVGTNPPASGYYGAFQDNTSQTAASINTAYAVKLNTTDLTNGVSVVNDGSSNPTRVTLANTGIYNIQFSLQLEKTGGSGNMIADIWIRKNGVDIPSTTGKVVLTGSANASPVVAAWNYVLDLAAGDYIQLMWSTSNTNVEIVAAVATSPHPAIPSAILTVTQQAGILAGTGITAINSLTGAAQTMVTGTDSTDFKIVSSGTSHTFNLPTASATKRGALSTTDWTTFNNKLSATDTVSLSNRINSKLNISDTSALQRKSIPAYSIMANNTSVTANVTAQQFRDTSGVYNGTITWTGTTAPSGATNHSYRLTQVGKCVTLHISLVYAVNGALLTALQMTLPTNAPTPVQPSGLTGALSNMYPLNGQLANSANTILSSSSRGYLRNNTAGNGFELILNFATASPAQVGITLQYWTN